MNQGFNRNEVTELLVCCHRRCCICHRFCGTKIETDHIEPAAESNDHSIENAIPVCFDCHAEIHAYNPRHPRGRRFTADELRRHKAQWLEICATRPEVLLEAARDTDIGPLQGLLDELEHNLIISRDLDYQKLGFLYQDTQLTRAIREGVLSILEDNLRISLSAAYGAISQANEMSRHHVNQSAVDRVTSNFSDQAMVAVQRAIPLIQTARDQLLQFVRSEPEGTLA